MKWRKTERTRVRDWGRKRFKGLSSPHSKRQRSQEADGLPEEEEVGQRQGRVRQEKRHRQRGDERLLGGRKEEWGGRGQKKMRK